MRHPTRVWYLEQRSPSELRRARVPAGIDALRTQVPVGALNRFFYVEVGRGHHWVDLLPWSPQRWQRFAEGVETWIALDRGTPAGYAELAQSRDGSIDVPHFGLLEPFRARGIGGHLLTLVARRAWELGAQRVTLNTCELDGPGALHNYRARGFQVVREVIEQRSREGG